MIMNNQQVTNDEAAYHHGSARNIIHNCLGFHKVCAS
jgi:hypothetical protein